MAADERPQDALLHLHAGPAAFAFAGLWEHWQGAAGEAIESCSIIVTEANDLIQPIHDRMPVILSPEDYALWLDPEVTRSSPSRYCCGLIPQRP